MGDLTRGLDELLEHRAAARDDAVAPAGVRAAIVRRRRRRAGLWSVGAAVVLATVGAAALPTVMDALPSAAPSASPSPVLSVTERVIADATVSFDDAHAQWMWGPGLTTPDFCGEAPPQPRVAEDGLRAQVEHEDSVTLDQERLNTRAQASMAIAYGRGEALPVVVGPLMGLIIEDGVVVGFVPGSSEAGLQTFRSAVTTTVEWSGQSSAIRCPTEDEPRYRQLEAGDYEMVWSVDLRASESINAAASIRSQGFRVPTAHELTAFREGSYECLQAADWGMDYPLTCDPSALPGTRVDLEAGEITFPYEADAYVRDVDVTFATEPVPLTVEGYETDPWEWIQNEYPPHEPGTPMECGAQYAGLDGSPLEVRGAVPRLGLDPGAAIELEAWYYGTQPRLGGRLGSWTEATVTMPQQARGWLLETVNRTADTGDGSYSYGLDTVIGEVTVTLPPQLDVSRYDGPVAMTVTVDDVAWCDGPPDGSGSHLTMSIQAPHTIVEDDGPTEYATLVLRGF